MKISFNLFTALMFCFVAHSSVRAQQMLVRPYLQPGDAPTLSKEQKVILWQTDQVPGDFTVTVALYGQGNKVVSIKPSSIQLKLKGKTSYLYRAVLSKLQFDTIYRYQVQWRDKILASDSFHTRSKKPFSRFAVLGDFGAGTSQQAAIANQMAGHKPQFIITTGDNAYPNGLEEDYRSNVFPYYLPQENATSKGAALMNTIPFYMVLGNHDVRMDSLDKEPGSFAYFYYNDLPMNGPYLGYPIVKGTAQQRQTFRKNTKPRFPGMSNFSFEYGNVHFTCLDANNYVNPRDPALLEWLQRDLSTTKADWKIVVFHEPGFNSSKAHYDYQFMRLLAPEFEKLKVNLVLTGHVHNYQRSVPLTFRPETNSTGDQYIVSPEGRVNGTFELDTLYDGMTRTKPKGIIYVVTGAGGGGLYDKQLNQKPETWRHDIPGNWVPFTSKLISDRHSFTLIETDQKVLILKQIDLTGRVLDEIRVTQ